MHKGGVSPNENSASCINKIALKMTIWQCFFLVLLILMGFAKDCRLGCVGKFHLSSDQQSCKWVSLEGTTLRWLLLSFVSVFVCFFHLMRMRGVSRHETLSQYFFSVVFRLTLISFDRMMEVREYHYWHAGERGDKAHAARSCVCAREDHRPSLTVATSVCPRGSVCQDESPLWSVSLWSAITVPCSHSCSLRLKSCSLTNAVWFAWKKKKNWMHP